MALSHCFNKKKKPHQIVFQQTINSKNTHGYLTYAHICVVMFVCLFFLLRNMCLIRICNFLKFILKKLSW